MQSALRTPPIRAGKIDGLPGATVAQLMDLNVNYLRSDKSPMHLEAMSRQD